MKKELAIDTTFGLPWFTSDCTFKDFKCPWKIQIKLFLFEIQRFLSYLCLHIQPYHFSSISFLVRQSYWIGKVTLKRKTIIFFLCVDIDIRNNAAQKASPINFYGDCSGTIAFPTMVLPIPAHPPPQGQRLNKTRSWKCRPSLLFLGYCKIVSSEMLPKNLVLCHTPTYIYFLKHF